MTNHQQEPVHTIRLRRPWQKQFAQSDLVDRIDVPETDATDSELSDSDSPANAAVMSATYTRRFNRPTGLDDTSQLRLRIDSWRGELQSLIVNDQELAPLPCPVDAEITHLLSNQNCITIVLNPTTTESENEMQPVQLTGPVVLAILQDER